MQKVCGCLSEDFALVWLTRARGSTILHFDTLRIGIDCAIRVGNFGLPFSILCVLFIQCGEVNVCFILVITNVLFCGCLWHGLVCFAKTVE